MPSDLEKAGELAIAICDLYCPEHCKPEIHMQVRELLESALREQEPGPLKESPIPKRLPRRADVAAAQPQLEPEPVHPDDDYSFFPAASPAPEPQNLEETAQNAARRMAKRVLELQAELTALREDAQRVVDMHTKWEEGLERWTDEDERKHDSCVADLRSRLAQPEKERK